MIICFCLGLELYDLMIASEDRGDDPFLNWEVARFLTFFFGHLRDLYFFCQTMPRHRIQVVCPYMFMCFTHMHRYNMHRCTRSRTHAQVHKCTWMWLPVWVSLSRRLGNLEDCCDYSLCFAARVGTVVGGQVHVACLCSFIYLFLISYLHAILHKIKT